LPKPFEVSLVAGVLDSAGKSSDEIARRCRHTAVLAMLAHARTRVRDFRFALFVFVHHRLTQVLQAKVPDFH
jgi:hypothetical protein